MSSPTRLFFLPSIEVSVLGGVPTQTPSPALLPRSAKDRMVASAGQTGLRQRFAAARFTGSPSEVGSGGRVSEGEPKRRPPGSSPRRLGDTEGTDGEGRARCPP